MQSSLCVALVKMEMHCKNDSGQILTEDEVTGVFTCLTGWTREGSRCCERTGGSVNLFASMIGVIFCVGP
jgi:hypothetical protein